VPHEHRASEALFLAASEPGTAAAADADVAIIGVPYDGAVTYRGGARFAPPRIRAASDSIETYCPKFDLDLADRAVVDFGDLKMPEAGSPGRQVVDAITDGIAAIELPLLLLGGDHLVACAPLWRMLARHPNLQIFHIDAHTDLRDSWEGEAFNHATVLRRALDRMPATARLHSWGIRSGLREEFALARDDARIELVDNTAAAGLARATELAAGDAPIYVTFDADGLDPSALSGTGTPEPGGLMFEAVEAALVALGRGRARIVGADLVEVAPTLDPSGVTDVVAARLARTMLLALRATNAR
jgi:agmatinase